MIDISRGRYWDEGIELISGCTPCSPGCAHCWSAGQAHRFMRTKKIGQDCETIPIYTNNKGHFNGHIVTHPERLKRFNTRKPKVFSIWNDLFHEAVPTKFIDEVIEWMYCTSNTYLVLTKRPERMSDYLNSLSELVHEPLTMFGSPRKFWPFDHVFCGLTVCNQQEADEKIPIFLQVPGKKFLSIEPMLGGIDFNKIPPFDIPGDDDNRCWHYDAPWDEYIDAVILGGETGPGARPMHPDWVRSVRDQCQSVGVPFFFKSWGAYGLNWMNDDNGKIEGSEWMDKSIKKPGRMLDGRTHDELPWREK